MYVILLRIIFLIEHLNNQNRLLFKRLTMHFLQTRKTETNERQQLIPLRSRYNDIVARPYTLPTF